MAELSEGTHCEASASSSQDPDRKASGDGDDGHSGDEHSVDGSDVKETKQDKETNSNPPSKTEGDLEQEDKVANENESNTQVRKRRKSERQSVMMRRRSPTLNKAKKEPLRKRERSVDVRRSGCFKEENDDKDDDEDSEEEQKWEMVTPEMIMETLGRNSHWRSTSTIEEVIMYLRLNFPVCQRLEELTIEVADKLTCAEEIGLVIKECTSDKNNSERIVNTYRLASPLEKTFLSEWEIKEFWSHYREILRRFKRQQKARYTARASRLRRNGTSRTRGLRRRARRTNTRKYRRRSAYSQYSSDDSIECGKDCCCRK